MPLPTDNNGRNIAGAEFDEFGQLAGGLSHFALSLSLLSDLLPSPSMFTIVFKSLVFIATLLIAPFPLFFLLAVFVCSKALCCKMSVEFDSFLASGRKWWCHFDDDNYVNIPRLVELLRTFSPLDDWYLGKPSVRQPLEIEDRDAKVSATQSTDKFLQFFQSSLFPFSFAEKSSLFLCHWWRRILCEPSAGAQNGSHCEVSFRRVVNFTSTN